jgi:hypothetical protein
MITRTLIAVVAIATAVLAVSPAYSAPTVFGDRIEGLAAAITGNFTTPERFRPNSAILGDRQEQKVAAQASGQRS